jgi:hypothetical protein
METVGVVPYGGELIWIAEEDQFLDLIIMVDEREEMYPEF